MRLAPADAANEDYALIVTTACDPANGADWTIAGQVILPYTPDRYFNGTSTLIYDHVRRRRCMTRTPRV